MPLELSLGGDRHHVETLSAVVDSDTFVKASKDRSDEFYFPGGTLGCLSDVSSGRVQ